jgi:hypothetical protein
MKHINRRTVLRGLLSTGATATIGLPLLEIMLNESGTALAQGEPISPLYVTWFFGNGTLPGLWKPSSTGAGDAWQLSPQLMPLSEFKADMTVISGLEGRLVVPGVEHPTGSAAATTAAPLNGTAVRAPSIDQVVSQVISSGEAFRSIEVGVTPATPGGPQDSLHSVSHNGPNSRNDAEYDPKAVFARLFGGFEVPTTDDGASDAEKMARVRKSVLDSVLEDGKRLQSRLGATDNQRIESHLEAIRAMERRISTIPDPTQTPSCTVPAVPTVGSDTRGEAPPEVNAAMAELTALALACDRTKVATFTFTLPAAHVYYRHLAADMDDDFHDIICHSDAGDSSNQPRVDAGVQYAMRSLNEFLLNLKNTAHGASNLLDSALVYVTSDTAWGKVHDAREWPVLLLGKAGGRLRGNEHHNFEGENLSRALLTVAQIMGSTQTEIGMDIGLATETLPGIIA